MGNPLIAYQRDPLDRRLVIQAHTTRGLGKQMERPGKMAKNLPGLLKYALVATKPPSAYCPQLPQGDTSILS